MDKYKPLVFKRTEFLNDTVESGTLVSETFFTSAKCSEVFSRFGNNISAQFHHNTTYRIRQRLNNFCVKKNYRVVDHQRSCQRKLWDLPFWKRGREESSARIMG
jgi:hypothetical protein